MKRIGIKVDNLRKIYGREDMTAEKWLEDSNNVYIGRYVRIFIGKGDNKKRFELNDTKWGNPYKVGTEKGKYSLEESLKLYKKHITKKIEEDPEYYDLGELREKNLGCFCDQDAKCHGDILLALIKEHTKNTNTNTNTNTKNTKKWIYFYDADKEYGEFSNFYPYVKNKYIHEPIDISGKKYLTVEHYFQSQKFPDFPEYQEKVRKASTPTGAKWYGQICKQVVDNPSIITRQNLPFAKKIKDEIIEEYITNKVSLRDDWEKVKDSIMFKGLMAKFTQDKHSQKVLLSTGDNILSENSGSRDKYWGNDGDMQKIGKLGELLMKVRENIVNHTIKNKGTTKPLTHKLPTDQERTKQKWEDLLTVIAEINKHLLLRCIYKLGLVKLTKEEKSFKEHLEKQEESIKEIHKRKNQTVILEDMDNKIDTDIKPKIDWQKFYEAMPHKLNKLDRLNWKKVITDGKSHWEIF